MDSLKKNTYFVDIDGTIFKYRPFETYMESEAEVIKSTKDFLIQRKKENHMIILTTARPEWLREHTIKELTLNDIPWDRLEMGIERGPRYIINDMDPKNPGKRALAINTIRDNGI
jgi:uncharacterized HAD superfamily protein